MKVITLKQIKEEVIGVKGSEKRKQYEISLTKKIKKVKRIKK